MRREIEEANSKQVAVPLPSTRRLCLKEDLCLYIPLAGLEDFAWVPCTFLQNQELEFLWETDSFVTTPCLPLCVPHVFQELPVEHRELSKWTDGKSQLPIQLPNLTSPKNSQPQFDYCFWTLCALAARPKSMYSNPGPPFSNANTEYRTFTTLPAAQEMWSFNVPWSV